MKKKNADLDHPLQPGIILSEDGCYMREDDPLARILDLLAAEVSELRTRVDCLTWQQLELFDTESFTVPCGTQIEEKDAAT